MIAKKLIINQSNCEIEDQELKYIETKEGNLTLEIPRYLDLWDMKLINQIETMSKEYEIVFANRINCMMETIMKSLEERGVSFTDNSKS